MKRISKKTRDEAILICAIAASSAGITPYTWITDSLRASDASYSLACAAVEKVHESKPRYKKGVAEWCEQDAEAECLLRDGWSPGDPVEAL